jgi:purine-binding chemotaxis protein CheW
MPAMDNASIFHDIVSLKTDLTNLRYDMIARRDEIKFVLGSRDPTLSSLKKVWIETMQLATKAAELFEHSSMNLENSMSALGSLVNGLRSAMQRTQALSKSAGKVLERSYIVIFELAGKEYCFHVDTVQEVIAPKQLVNLPEMPYFMKGVMEHRKMVIPIIDPALILGVKHLDGRQRLILVRKNGDSVALLVDNVRQIAPVLSGYFRQPKSNEPLLRMVYEDGTTKIDMLDPKLMLEAGLQKAFGYARRINGAPSTHFHGPAQVGSSRSSAPFEPLRSGQSTQALRSAA